MDVLKKLFPYAWSKGNGDSNAFVVGIIIHVLVLIFGGLVVGLPAALVPIGIVKWLCGVAGTLLDLYALVSLILLILVKCKVLK